MNRVTSIVGSSLLTLLAYPAAAHHNWSALYDVDSDIEIEGVISSIQWRNPHVRISFTVDEGTPNEKVYTTESNSVASLTRMDVTDDLLAVGTRVRVAGYRSRTRDDDIFMNHLLMPDNREIVFQRTAEPRWPEASRVGGTDRLHGLVVEEDFSERPTTVFSVWNTVYGAEGSHQAMRFPRDEFQIDYREERGIGPCASKDVWVAMGTPYPMQLVDNGDTVTVHMEEFDTIRHAHMGIEHNNPGTYGNNLGYSTGRMDNGRLLVTTSWEGSGSPIRLYETFELTSDHSRLLYTSTLVDPESNRAPTVNSKWWEYQPGAFVQPYDCSP